MSGKLDQDLILKLVAFFNKDIEGTGLDREYFHGFSNGDLLDLQMQLNWLQDALKTYLQALVLPEQESANLDAVRIAHVSSLAFSGLKMFTGGHDEADSSPSSSAGESRNVRPRVLGVGRCIGSGVHSDAVATLPESLASTFEDDSPLRSYAEVAEKLTQQNYYTGQFSAIAEFARKKWSGGFIVLDLPSGEGKTLFGVALYLLDKNHNPRQNLPSVLAEVNRNWKVIHSIWPNAVLHQRVYEVIIETQKSFNIYPNTIFERAKFLIPSMYESDGREAYVWFTVLQYLFRTVPPGTLEEFNLPQFLKSFELDNCKLVLFLDEIPIEVEDVLLITKLRDACKNLQNVIVILSGTNSKAANMLGMAEASTQVTSSKPWAVLVTRTPSFQIELSPLRENWNSTKEKVLTDFLETDLNLAVEAIESSIRTHGNSRLISMAISTLDGLIRSEQKNRDFHQFRVDFSAAVFNSKFLVGRCSHIFSGLVGQLNMLCEASTIAEFADAVISSHYARRAVPDSGLTSGTLMDSVLEDCAGHLYISADTERCLGNLMYYIKGKVRFTQNPNEMVRSWQTAVFSSFGQDMLLYLAACRANGFFGILGGACTQQFRTYEVCLSAWKWNAAGLINFQNIRAKINPGSLLEIITTASICNAAAVKIGSGVSEFMVEFAKELGIGLVEKKLKNFRKETTCEEFVNIKIPACVFPGNLPALCMRESIGIVKRVDNLSEFDVELILQNGPIIRFEVKDRKKFSSRNVWNAASKLFAAKDLVGVQIGVLVVQRCCNYWGAVDKGNDRPALNRARIVEFFKTKKTKLVERIYFVRSDGELSIVNISAAAQSPNPQFLFVFQVKYRS